MKIGLHLDNRDMIDTIKLIQLDNSLRQTDVYMRL